MSGTDKPVAACVDAYTHALYAGELQRAYRAILSALTAFKSAWESAYPQDHVGALYQGYLDMSFVSFSPAFLAEKRLKTLFGIPASRRAVFALAGGGKPRDPIRSIRRV